jgi:hypothetical protein
MTRDARAGAEGVAQEGHDGGAPFEAEVAVAVGRAAVLGEALLELVPEFLVERAAVAVLEPLDRFDLV